MEGSPNEQAKSRPHILMVPIDAAGHYYQMEKLLKLCSNHGPGLSVTVVSTESRCSELARMHADGELHGIDLHLEPLFTDILLYLQDLHFPIRVGFGYGKFLKEFEPFGNELIALKEKGLPGVPTCVISDFAFSFAGELAIQLDVPWYPMYVPAPAFAAVTCLAAPTVWKEGLHPFESPRRNEMIDIPGGQFARVRDIYVENMQFPDYWNHHSEVMIRAAGLLFNTAEELDAPAGTLEAIRVETELRARAVNLQGPKVFAIGPLLNLTGFTGPGSNNVQEAISSPVLEFLDSHPASSVLYISFGSIANIAPESLTELAHGLEASRVPFVWAVKFSTTLDGATLPPGFTERTRGRGYIEKGWAPQSQILLHPSTGGFLSHCGWNSVLESLCSGMPVVTWPVSFDQPLNARFVENISKTGVCVKAYAPGDEVILRPTRDDVSRAIRLIMIDEEGKDFRKNAMNWRSVLTAAVEEGGSSNKAMKQLLDQVLLRSEGNRES